MRMILRWSLLLGQNALEIMGYGSAEKNRIRDFGNSRKTQRRRLHSGHAKVQDNLKLAAQP